MLCVFPLVNQETSFGYSFFDSSIPLSHLQKTFIIVRISPMVLSEYFFPLTLHQVFVGFSLSLSVTSKFMTSFFVILPNGLLQYLPITMNWSEYLRTRAGDSPRDTRLAGNF